MTNEFLLKNLIEEVKPKYSAILLYERSRNILVDFLMKNHKNVLTDDWKLISHHMTIDPFNIIKDDRLLGQRYELTVTHFGIDDKCCAVKVTGYDGKTNNKFPHVTLAVNLKNGGKPKDSNNIVNWTEIENKFKISGVVKNL